MFFKKTISEKDLHREELLWTREKKLIERQQKLRDEKKSLLQRKKITTTKWLIIFLFLNCTLVEFFTGWAILKEIELSSYTGITPDLSPLNTLIGTVIGEVMGFAIYAAKSAKENSLGGIVYDNAIINNNSNIDYYAGYSDTNDTPPVG